MHDTSDTAGRIIQAAEKLFSEQGFKETTMRQITSLAEVNLAAVNYHFGSKLGLVRSVAERSLSPLCDQIERGLASLKRSESEPDLDHLLRVMAEALVHVHSHNRNALSVLMRLLNQAYLPSQHDLKEFLRARYGVRFDGYLQYLRVGATLDEREFFWRLHFLLGSVIFTLSNMHVLNALDQEGDAAEVELDHILSRMIPVISAGMKAPVRNGTH